MKRNPIKLTGASQIGKLVSDREDPSVSADFLVDMTSPNSVYLRPMNKIAQAAYGVIRGIVAFDKGAEFYEISDEEAKKLNYK